MLARIKEGIHNGIHKGFDILDDMDTYLDDKHPVLNRGIIRPILLAVHIGLLVSVPFVVDAGFLLVDEARMHYRGIEHTCLFDSTFIEKDEKIKKQNLHQREFNFQQPQEQQKKKPPVVTYEFN